MIWRTFFIEGIYFNFQHCAIKNWQFFTKNLSFYSSNQTFKSKTKSKYVARPECNPTGCVKYKCGNGVFWHSLWNNGGPLFSCDIKLSRQWPPRRGRGRCVVHSAVKAAAFSALLLNSKDATFVTASQRAFRRSLHCSIPPNCKAASWSSSMTNYKTMIIPMMYILIFLNLAVDICGKFLVYFQNTFESVRLKVYVCTSIQNEISLTFICAAFPLIRDTFLQQIKIEPEINTKLFTLH